MFLLQSYALNGVVHIFENSWNISSALAWSGIHLNKTADFSLKADDMKTKYLVVNGVRANLWIDPKYSFP